jgi:lambda repressor-like predicted transcriptional regulator
MQKRKIDKITTRNVLKSNGWTMKGFARDHDINDDSFKSWFRRSYSEESNTHKLCVGALKKHGYLRYYDASLK